MNSSPAPPGAGENKKKWRFDERSSSNLHVTASVNPSETAHFILDAEADLRPQEGNGEVFVVPDGIAFTQIIYLLLIMK